MRYNIDVILAVFVGLLLGALAWASGAFEKRPCPATQPGLIVRDLDHPTSERIPDQEWIVTGAGGVLEVGLNRVQAEGLAYQLNQMFGKEMFTARKALTVESTKPNEAPKPAEAKP